ncbi:MAG: hypothetical protein ABI300_06900 [Rhodanobacter sp.]
MSDAHRMRVLRALGVTPWVRRASALDASPTGALEASEVIGPGNACVVVLAPEASRRQLGLLDQALASGGPALARAPRVVTRDGQLGDVPPAAAYLVFGEAQAHALGRALPADTLRSAQIVLVDALPAVLTDPSAKRRLWVALRGLRRTLAAAAG